MNLEVIKRELANLATLCDVQDQQLLADMIEGETDAHRIISKLLAEAEEAQTLANALGEQIKDRQERKKRLEARHDHMRDHVATLMQIAGLKSLPLPEATLSIRQIDPKRNVTDPDKLPDEFCTFVRKPDLTAIRAADGAIPGTQFDNGGTSLTVRRK